VVWIVNIVNSQPKQLTSDESRYLRHQLQGVRDQINQLLDNLDCQLPVSAADTADSTAAVGGTAHVPAATSASTDPLTGHKYARDGTTAGSVDAGQSLFSNESESHVTQNTVVETVVCACRRQDQERYMSETVVCILLLGLV